MPPPAKAAGAAGEVLGYLRRAVNSSPAADTAGGEKAAENGSELTLNCGLKWIVWNGVLLAAGVLAINCGAGVAVEGEASV
ncbi:MAG: hypothetical protein QOE47_3129 [Pyrinomonadaceae bacterium]|jgi:hypothetical protein|nr:hypothetical protein [Pyrinomonadaceae bacterium]